MSLPVRTTPEADAQIREVDGWWRANRPASPNLFAEELAASFDTIVHTPDIGGRVVEALLRFIAETWGEPFMVHA